MNKNNVTFTISPHSVAYGKTIVEARDENGNLLATITQGDNPRTIRIISKHLRDPFTQVTGEFRKPSDPEGAPAFMEIKL